MRTFFLCKSIQVNTYKYVLRTHYCGMCVVCSVRTYVRVCAHVLLSTSAAAAALCVCMVSPGISGHWLVMV